MPTNDAEKRRAIQKRYRERHKDELAQKHRAYRAKNPDVARRAAKKYAAKNRIAMLAKKYGVSIERIESLPDAYEVCGSKIRLCIDHCHHAGYVRGRLCNGCNAGLGHFKDDPALLRAAAAYLEERSLV